MDLDERYALITRDLQEVLGENLIKDILKERDLNIYWGTACTGRPHIGYYVPLVKIADFLKAGCSVTIMIADIHGYLDNQKAAWDQLVFKKMYYEKVITEMLSSIKIPVDKLKFVTGSSYQLNSDYTMDVYRLAGIVTEHDARKAGAEVVKQSANPILSGLLYPLLQALDEEYLKVDCQFGGADQRKIFTFAEKYLPAMGYKKRAHLLNTMLPGLTGAKMSSSEANTKVDLIDDEGTIRKKISRAFCEPKNIDNNPILNFIKKVAIPIREHLGEGTKIPINRPEKFGGPVEFNNYAELESAFSSGEIHPTDIKGFTADVIVGITGGIRKAFSTPENQNLIKKAYPNGKSNSSGPKSGSPVTSKAD